MKTLSRFGGIAALVFATSAWGGLFHVGKFALDQLDPFWFTVVRYICATLLLVGLLHLHGAVRWEQLRANWKRLASSGMLGYGMFGIMVFIGLDHSVPSHDAVIMATIPVTTLVSRWLLDRQRPHWSAWAVVALTVLGVVLVSGVLSAKDGNVNTALGDLTALVGTFGWVAYTRGQGKLNQLSVIEYTAFTAILAVPGLIAVAVIATLLGFAHVPSASNLTQAAPALAYIVAVGTVAAGLAYNKGVRTLGISQGIVFINFVPVSALLIGLMRGTVPTSAELLGIVLVVSALLLQAKLMKRQAVVVATTARAPATATAAR